MTRLRPSCFHQMFRGKNHSMSTPDAKRLVFGIYPGGDTGSDSGIAAGPPDDPAQVERCLGELQGASQPFVLRVYERFSDKTHPSQWPRRAPTNYERYLRPGRLLDLVLMFQSASGDVKSFLEFAHELVERHANHLYSVQVTEEASFADGPDVIDGPYPNVQQALVEGVVGVKEFLRRAGKPEVKVGFNSTPTFGPSAGFWSSIGNRGGREFREAVDYVGIDFFPDVFSPAAPDGQSGDVRGSALAVLETMRNEWLPAAGIGRHVPIDIAEHGWPTGPTRSYERQAQVIETVIRTVWEARARLNIERYKLFDLRDTDSSRPEMEENIFYHFGITRHDYTAKPAFATYRKLIEEFGMR